MNKDERRASTGSSDNVVAIDAAAHARIAYSARLVAERVHEDTADVRYIDIDDGADPDREWFSNEVAVVYRAKDKRRGYAQEIARRWNAYPRLIAAICEYIAAADETVRGTDDIAAMLRFGEADKDIRALLRELGELK